MYAKDDTNTQTLCGELQGADCNGDGTFPRHSATEKRRKNM